MGDPRDSRYSSFTHTIAGRTFVVWEVSEWAGSLLTMRRELVEPATGEVMRSWVPQQFASLPPYDFAKMDAELRKQFDQPTYGINMSSTVAGAIYATSANTLTISNGNLNGSSTFIQTAPVQEFGIPPEAEFIEECRYGGACHYCTARIDVGSPIWWQGRDMLRNTRSRIWCGSHKTRPAATAVDQEHDTEDDDMLRDNFTFPYTGAEIAAGLEAQAVQLDAEAEAVTRLDPTTLEALFPSKGDREDKIAQVETKIKRLQEKAVKIRTEAKPYAKAGKQSFDLDLEDVAHFGLDADDAPAPRKIRKSRAKTDDLVGSAGGAAG